MLRTKEQRDKISGRISNDHPYFGTVVSGSLSSGWNVRFDILPFDDNIMYKIRRINLTVVSDKDEEEKILLKHENLEDKYYEDLQEVETTGTTQNTTQSIIVIEYFQNLRIEGKKN